MRQSLKSLCRLSNIYRYIGYSEFCWTSKSVQERRFSEKNIKTWNYFPCTHQVYYYVGDGGKYGGKFKYFRDLTMPQIMMMTSGLQICQGSQYNEKTLALLEATLTFKIDLTFYLVFFLNEKLAILYFRYW